MNRMTRGPLLALLILLALLPAPGFTGVPAAPAATRGTDGSSGQRAATARPASGAALRILTFNVEHLMSAERFREWRGFCEPHGWRDPPARDRPERLTYCNALDGSDGRGRRLFAPVHDEAAWQRKVDQQAALLRQADADIVLLQEVSDADAARLILGPHYRLATTAELWAGHAIAQNVAIAWRTTFPGPLPQAALIDSISQAGADGRRTRPGLALTVEPSPGRRLAILNVHLKAGCRQGRLGEATSRQPERAFRREADCAVFQRQVPAIERWADATLAAGTGVVIAGDFNRDVLREIRERMPARSDGSDPAQPADPRRIASLLAELSDEDPPAAWFTLVRAGPYGSRADCHRNISNFLLSRNLEPWLGRPLRDLKARVLPHAEPIALDRVRPSDHCPHLLELPLRAAQ